MIFEVEGRVKEITKKSLSRDFGIYVHSLYSVYKIRVFTNNTRRIIVNKEFNIKVDDCFICGKEHEFSFVRVEGKFVNSEIVSNFTKFRVNSIY